MIASALLLAACGSNDTEKAEEPVAVDQVDESAEGEVMDVTDDPMEAGNKNGKIEVFNDDFDYTYLIKEWYSTDDTDEDGFNIMDFDGYEVKYSMALMENTEGENVIGVFAETENNTDKVVQYNMDLEMITGNQEQTSSDSLYGIGSSNPGVKTKGFILVELDYDAPESFVVTFEPPWEDEGGSNEDIGEPIELEFSIE